MDSQVPQSISDVTKPGLTPATPTGRPVIAGNQNRVQDPMMAPPVPASDPSPATSTPLAVPTPEPSPTSPQPATVLAAVPQTTSQAEPVHDLAHQEAFFGHVGSHRSSKKWLITISVLILISGIVVGGWFLRRSRASKPPTTTKPTSTSSESISKKTKEPLSEAKITNIPTPDGYLVFSSTDLGYSFAFPNGFEKINLELTASQSDNGTVIYRSTGQLLNKDLNGQLMITQYPDTKADIVVGAGRSIMLKDNKWVWALTSGNNKTGDVYKGSDGKQPIAVNAGGLGVYTFSSVVGDDSIIVQLVFIAKGKLNIIELPVASTTTGMESQTILKNNILGTLKQL